MYVPYDISTGRVLLFNENNVSYNDRGHYKWVGAGLWETYTGGCAWELVVCDSWQILHDEIISGLHEMMDDVYYSDPIAERLKLAKNIRLIIQTDEGHFDFMDSIRITEADYHLGEQEKDMMT